MKTPLPCLTFARKLRLLSDLHIMVNQDIIFEFSSLSTNPARPHSYGDTAAKLLRSLMATGSYHE
jgi:hypothetical protein